MAVLAGPVNPWVAPNKDNNKLLTLACDGTVTSERVGFCKVKSHSKK